MTTDCATSRSARSHRVTPLLAPRDDDAAPDPEFVARLRTRLVAAASRRPGATSTDVGAW